MTTNGVTTTQTTIALAADRAAARGTTIPDILLHSFLVARSAVDRAKAAEKRVGDAITEYMLGENVTTLDTAEAKASRFMVADRGTFDREGLERDHPALYNLYYTPAAGAHPALRVTPKAKA